MIISAGEPPTTSTRPSSSVVAVWKNRACAIGAGFAEAAAALIAEIPLVDQRVVSRLFQGQVGPVDAPESRRSSSWRHDLSSPFGAPGPSTCRFPSPAELGYTRREMARIPIHPAANTGRIERESSPIIKGIALGLANALVIAIGLVGPDVGGILFVLLFGGVPAVVTGGLLGGLAELTASRSPRWRVVLLALPALAAVAGLGKFFEATAEVPVACIPTVVAALILERWTRQVVPEPVATARSSRP